MEKDKLVGLDELFQLFEDKITLADINASKYLGKISAAIVKRRIEMDMTQKEFAAHIDVSQAMVSKWESGDYNFTVRGLAELAEKLDMELYINFKEYREHTALIHDEGFACYQSGNSTFIGKSSSNIVNFRIRQQQIDLKEM